MQGHHLPVTLNLSNRCIIHEQPFQHVPFEKEGRATVKQVSASNSLKFTNMCHFPCALPFSVVHVEASNPPRFGTSDFCRFGTSLDTDFLNVRDFSGHRLLNVRDFSGHRLLNVRDFSGHRLLNVRDFSGLLQADDLVPGEGTRKG